MKWRAFLFLFPVLLLVFACSPRTEELSQEEIDALKTGDRPAILDQMIEKHGPADWDIGTPGGTWTSTISNDPKTFNLATNNEGETGDILDLLFPALAAYDPYKKEFIPDLASFEIEVNEESKTLDVIYTLKENIYWTSPDGSINIELSSDDIVYWYNEIAGDPELQNPLYNSQFVDMPDGSRERITIEKLDKYRFVFHFPRIIANPILASNSQFGPRYLFEEAKKNGGINGIRELLTIDTDVMTIPSAGAYHIVEFSPGVRLRLKRNPGFYKTDEAGNPLPYFDEIIYKIVPETNTKYLLFKSGDIDVYGARPEDLDELLKDSKDYDVYNGGQSLGSSFISFNQNEEAMAPLQYSWFSQKEFRQAMSCMLNRQRIADQVYRGLAVPAHYIFARANPMFDPAIKNPYIYNVDHALELLNSIGMNQGEDGLMYDALGNKVEFEITVGTGSNIGIDMMNIFSDELSQIGITAKVRPIDFQKLVSLLTETYDWQVVTVALGSNYWPSGGVNVWPSSGNLHLWHPLQESPATDWEARIDYLYNEGRFTLDPADRKVIYDEFQTLLLEQQPLIYMVYPMSFSAFRHGWGNIYFDTLGVPDGNRIYALD